MRIPIILAAIALAIALAASALAGAAGAVGAQVPNGPFIYYGTAAVNGQPVPDGYQIHAAVGDYVSAPVPVSDGKYEELAVSPQGRNYHNQTVTFHLGDVQAAETATFRISGVPVLHVGWNLTFPNLPVPTFTPTPGTADVPPTSTPAPPTPTYTPTPTPTYTPTPTPTSGWIASPQFVPSTPGRTCWIPGSGDRFDSVPGATASATPPPFCTPTPTITPTPAPTHTPTITPAPTAVPVAPRISLHSDKPEVEIGEDVKIEISWDNSIANSQTYLLEVSLKIPSGMIVSSSEGVQSSGGGRHSGTFEIPPNSKRVLTVIAQALKAGENRVEMTGNYFPLSDSSQSRPVNLTRAIIAKAPQTPTPTNTPIFTGGSENGGGGGGCGRAVSAGPMSGAGEMALGAFLLGALWTLSRRNSRNSRDSRNRRTE